MAKNGTIETVHPPPELREGPAAYDRTADLLRRALRVPKAEIDRREAAYKKARSRR